MQAFKPISQAATRRAEQADPNGCRCLVENCPKERAVELAYVFDRENSSDTAIMKSVEWSWGMRKGTLNLDTRRNVFFLGASMHSLYKAGKWALMPPEGIVDLYLTEPLGEFLGIPLSRESFPTISETTFEYTFLPLDEISTFGITRQDANCDPCSEAAYKTHIYPFKTLPTLTSHVHPNFALLHLSSLLVDRISEPYIANLIHTNTLIAKISRLSMRWCFPELPRQAKYDPTFLTNPPPMRDEGSDWGSDDHNDESDEDSEDSGYDDLGYQSSEGDSTCTPPRRVRYIPTRSRAPPQVQSIKRPSEDSNQEQSVDNRVGKGTKRRRISPPEAKGERSRATADLAEEQGSSWTKEAISSWARECSASPEVPDSPAPPLATGDGA